MTTNRLSARKVQTAAPGMHSDGQGLYLKVSPTGSKRWLYRFTLKGRTSEVGLGLYPAIGLEDARRAAFEARQLHRGGVNPVEAKRKAETLAPTFEKLAADFIETRGAEWRNARHRGQWEMTFREYCAPINAKRVDEIEVANVLEVLKPIWLTIPSTASRLRCRIESVLDNAKAQGLRTGENPATWRGNLKHLLPRHKIIEKHHHPAVPYDELQAFVAELRKSRAYCAAALEFLILTAARTGEVRFAVWSEIDFKAKIWSIPATRMKTGRAHRVPLSKRCIEILEKQREKSLGDYIFARTKSTTPFAANALLQLTMRIAPGKTAHGFRSTFRDWCGDKTLFQREVIEAALAHIVGDAAENAYRRADAIEKRGELMAAWAAFAEPHADAKVVSIRKKVS
jgi:integrase